MPETASHCFDFAQLDFTQLPTGTYWEFSGNGLGLRVIRPGVAFYVARGEDGSLVMLGTPEKLALEEARELACRLRAEQAPIVPEAPKPKTQAMAATTVTLRRAWHDYNTMRVLRPATKRNYCQRLEGNLGEWLDLPLGEISREMCLLKFAEITKRGKTTANYTFRTLKAVFNFAIAYYEDEHGQPLIKQNPVLKLKQVGAWHKDNVRRRSIALELGPWLRAVMSLNNNVWRDFFLLLLFTGMRKGECQRLRWDQCNLKTGVISLSEEDTKTHMARDIPLSDFAWKLLLQRQYVAHPRETYVFQMKSGRPPQEVRQRVAEVAEKSGVQWACHDLRRTWASVADEFEIKQQVVAQLLGHAGGSRTEAYTVRSLSRLRRASQQITDGILELAKHERYTPDIPPHSISLLEGAACKQY